MSFGRAPKIASSADRPYVSRVKVPSMRESTQTSLEIAIPGHIPGCERSLPHKTHVALEHIKAAYQSARHFSDEHKSFRGSDGDGRATINGECFDRLQRAWVWGRPQLGLIAGHRS